MTISGGTVRLGDGGTSGSIIGDIVNNGALIYDRSDSYVDLGAISGSGTVTHQGSGTTTLAAVNSYTGLTSVNAGRLDVDGVIAGSAQVAGDATLLGSGSINGTVTVLAGGHLTPGELPGEGAGTLAGRLAGAESRFAARLQPRHSRHRRRHGERPSDRRGLADPGRRAQHHRPRRIQQGRLPAHRLRRSADRQRARHRRSCRRALPHRRRLDLHRHSRRGQSGRRTGGFDLQYWDGPYGFGNGQVDGGNGYWNPFYSNWTNESRHLQHGLARWLRGVPGRPGHGNPGRVHRRSRGCSSAPTAIPSRAAAIACCWGRRRSSASTPE